MSVEMWPVSRALKEIIDSYDRIGFDGDRPECWFYLMQDKLSFYDFEGLIESIETHGLLDPICILDGSLGNGHHRLIAAILLGMDVVPVDTSGWYSGLSDKNRNLFNIDLGVGYSGNWYADQIRDTPEFEASRYLVRF